MPFKTLSDWCSHLSGLAPSADQNPSEGIEDALQPDLINPAEIVNSLSGNSSIHSTLLQSISRPAMGCEFEVLLNEHQHPFGVERSIESLRIIDQMEDLLSVYRPQSQISKLNQFACQRPIWVDCMTLELIQLAIDVHGWTLGAFDITAGSLSEVWGFARRQGTMPTAEQIQESLTAVGSQHVHVHLQDSTVSLDRPGIRLNSGGIGKGFALDYASQHLQNSGVHDFMIHGGQSSIVARGSRSGWEADHWNVALKHPWRSDETLEIISLRNQALGTSGSGKQFFHFGGKRFSHLIDPRSGWPADQMMSVTVICPSGAVADALATGLFILGPKGAAEFCESHSEISALFVYAHPKSGKQCIEHRNWIE